MERADRARTWGHLVLGAAVPAGWLLYDLIKVLVSTNPAAFVTLLPGAVLVVALGAAFGWGASRLRWLLPAGFALAVLAVLVISLADRAFAPLQTWLPRVALLLLVAFLTAVPEIVARKLGALRVGLAGGFLVCHAATVLRISEVSLPTSVVGLAPLAILLGLVKVPWVRYAGTALLLAYPGVKVWGGAMHHASSQRPDLPSAGIEAAPGAPNLLLIVMDTTRADHLAPYGYERETTPQLDAFVREHAILYTRARSTGPYTLPSHASMLTGLFSAEHGADHPRDTGQEVEHRVTRRPAVGLREDVPTLAETLRDHGYRTGAIVANSAYLNHVFGLGRGFEHYDDRDGAWLSGHITLPQFWGWQSRIGHRVFRDGGLITEAALDWIRSDGGSEPFFLMLNYMDAHNPFIPPSFTARAFGDQQPLDMLDPEFETWPILYDRGLLALDSYLARLLGEMRSSGLLERTVVIITSDHGEAFGEHDFWSHAWNLYDELVHVPLYVKPVGGRPRTEDDTLVTSVHIPHIALGALGLEAGPFPETDGLTSEWYHGASNPEIDDWSERTGRDVAIDLLAWVEEGRKFIVGSNGQVQAFDIERDPDELTELALSSEEIEAAVERARKWWADHPPRVTQGLEIDAGVLGRLEDLGYFGDQ